MDETSQRVNPFDKYECERYVLYCSRNVVITEYNCGDETHPIIEDVPAVMLSDGHI